MDRKARLKALHDLMERFSDAAYAREDWGRCLTLETRLVSLITHNLGTGFKVK